MEEPQVFLVDLGFCSLGQLFLLAWVCFFFFWCFVFVFSFST